MKPRNLCNNVWYLGAIDWDRRLFDSLIPLPDGTSYNAYLIKGSEKSALLDTVDPSMSEILLKNLSEIDSVDYVIAHHAEQDHSGSLPLVLNRFPKAKVVTSPKGKEMLIDHLLIPVDKFLVVDDESTLNLGSKTLKFLFTPWVHWPETMCSYLVEDKILFSCDFFGSHLASTDLYATDKPRVYEAAKRYYAEIMMPFRSIIKKNISKLEAFPIDFIAPSHGPVYDDPLFIINAYKDWISDSPKNNVVVAYISMHGSTKKMVEYLVDALSALGISVQQFDLAVSDLGKLAISLVDAASLVIGTPTLFLNPHPAVSYAVALANALRPKLKFASIIGSYGWSTKVVDKIAEQIPNLKLEILDPVLVKGLPKPETFAALDNLAASMATKHKQANLLVD